MQGSLVFGWPLMALLATAIVIDMPAQSFVPWRRQVEEVFAGQRDQIEAPAPLVTDAMLAQLAGATRLYAIELGQSDLTAEGVKVLQSLPNLRRVTLRGRPVDDAMFRELCRIPTLRFLNVPHTTVTDAGLAAVRERPQLIQLRIGSPAITDAGMEHVATLDRLRFLHLINVPLTDRGLVPLEKLPALESLYLDGAQTTDAGIERLLQHQKELHLHLDQQHSDVDPRKGTHEH